MINRISLFLFALVLMASAQNPVPSAFSFWQQIFFEDSTGIYRQVLEQKLEELMIENNEPEKEPELLWMLAEIQKDSLVSLPQARMNYLKLIALAPASHLAEQAHKRLAPFFLLHPELDSLLYNEIQNWTGQKSAERSFSFIRTMYELNMAELRPALRETIRLFLKSYPKSEHTDILSLWLGNLWAQEGCGAEAELTYREAIQLFPSSTVLPELRLNLARVWWQNLSKYEAARDLLITMLNATGEPQIQGNIQYELACMYEVGLKDTAEAIQNYHIFYSNYPQHRLYPQALARLARLSEQSSLYLEARNYLQLLFETVPPEDSLSTQALCGLERLYAKHISAPEKLAQVYLLHAARESAPRYLYKALLVFRKQVPDKDRAKTVLEKLCTGYPQSEWAKKAGCGKE